MIKFLLILFLFTPFVVLGQPKSVLANHPYISLEGSLHLKQHAPDSIYLYRHCQAFLSNPECYLNPIKANTASGIVIRFRTNSKQIRMNFAYMPQGQQRQPIFALYRDGKASELLKGLHPTWENTNGEMVEYKVYAPALTGLIFSNIEINNHATLMPLDKDDRPIYVAIGNSITHGVGQYKLSSDATYPAILAASMGWQLYNLAVGGSRITPDIAYQFDAVKPEVISILWGYNDWNANHHTMDELQDNYHQLLLNIRRQHPNSKILAILPTYTTSQLPKLRKDKVSIDLLRDGQKKVINSLQKKGDKNLYLIDGWKLTDNSSLIDRVHFSPEGAARFAAGLKEEIMKIYP